MTPPPPPLPRPGRLWLPYLAAALTLTALVFTFFIAPREREMGEVQRIFYFHVASAFAALLAWVGCAALSFAYLLLARRPSQDVLARGIDRLAWALGELGVLFGAIVLVTGPLWAKPVWQTYWTWEPRLVLVMLTEFLFIGYLVLRAYAKQDVAGRKLAAGIAIIGGPAVYLIHIAVELWGGNHPIVVSGGGGGLQDSNMQRTFSLSILAIMTLAAGIAALRMRQRALEADIEDTWLALSDLEDRSA